MKALVAKLVWPAYFAALSFLVYVGANSYFDASSILSDHTVVKAAPNSKYRAMVTPAKRGKGKKAKAANDKQDQPPAERHVAMTWAQRLKRVFNIDIETCRECGGKVRIIASIEDPVVIRKILAHLDDKVVSAAPGLLPECRAPPPPGLFV